MVVTKNQFFNIKYKEVDHYVFKSKVNLPFLCLNAKSGLQVFILLNKKIIFMIN